MVPSSRGPLGVGANLGLRWQSFINYFDIWGWVFVVRSRESCWMAVVMLHFSAKSLQHPDCNFWGYHWQRYEIKEQLPYLLNIIVSSVLGLRWIRKSKYWLQWYGKVLYLMEFLNSNSLGLGSKWAEFETEMKDPTPGPFLLLRDTRPLGWYCKSCCSVVFYMWTLLGSVYRKLSFLVVCLSSCLYSCSSVFYDRLFIWLPGCRSCCLPVCLSVSWLALGVCVHVEKRRPCDSEVCILTRYANIQAYVRLLLA